MISPDSLNEPELVYSLILSNYEIGMISELEIYYVRVLIAGRCSLILLFSMNMNVTI